MSLKVYQLRSLANAFDSYAGQRVSKIIQYGKDVFSFRLQRQGRVVIALDNQSPVLFLGGEEPGKTSLSTPASALLRKKLSGAEFVGAGILNDDRVLELRFKALNDIFEEEDLYIVLELIPTKANMAVLDKDRRILYAFRPNAITDPRPIFHGITYEPPLKKDHFQEEEAPFDVEAYYASCQGLEERLSEQRKNNIYQGFFRELRAKIKGLKHKIAQIEEDIEKGQRHLNDHEYGNYIYTFGDSIKLGDTSFDFYGQAIALDPLKTPQQNAAEFFRKAKKAKNAVALGLENKKTAEEELASLTRLLEFASSCDEETLSHLLEGGSKKGHSKQPPKHAVKANPLLPYVAHIGKQHFYFGKSAKQNDTLTFTYATKPTYLWFHVKDQVGAHVILPFDNPSDALIQQGCELALLATGKRDGEVQYTTHKNLRRGSVPGQVILGSYQSAFIRSISEEVEKAYFDALSKGGSR